MKLRHLLWAALMALPACGQGVLFTPAAQTLVQINGIPALSPKPGAYVTVCQITGVNCIATTVYSDQALTQPLAQPFQADAQGNVVFWALPGNYQYTACPVDGGACGGPYYIGGGNGLPPASPSQGVKGAIQASDGASGLQAADNTSLLNGLSVLSYKAVTDPLLATWQEGLHNARNQWVRVLVLGDSIFRCDQVSCGVGPIAEPNKPVSQFRDFVQQVNTHGTGRIPALAIVQNQTSVDPEHYTISGTWSYVNTLGPYQSTTVDGGASLIKANAGTVITFAAGRPYTNLVVDCARGPSTNGWTMLQGTANVGTACGAGSSEPSVIESWEDVGATQPVATYTSTLTCTATPCYFYAAEGRVGTSGVAIDNESVGSATSAFWATTPPTQLAFAVPNNSVEQTLLVVLELCTNDPGVLGAGSYPACATNLTTMINYLKTLSPVPSIAVVVPYASGIADAAEWPQYRAAIRGVAQAERVGLIDLQEMYGATTINCNSGLVGPDCIHPTDAMGDSVGGVLKAALVDNLPTPPPHGVPLSVSPSASGVAFYPGFAIDDFSWTFSTTPTATIAAGGTVATFTFGLPRYYSPGVGIAPNCSVQQAGAMAGPLFYPLAVTSTSVSFATASTLAAGSSFTYQVQCSGGVE